MIDINSKTTQLGMFNLCILAQSLTHSFLASLCSETADVIS